ncbi:hypothetical protein HYE67_000606 [Fusarium culmorum]|uniref:Uncharacterized protein n=1 Tax=Fusarium culmorum TaxID=5516 RepID=A0A7S8HRM9_FUSCU|nr:hypothetical protein HYE67_000606 [Fusarium culmorum]
MTAVVEKHFSGFLANAKSRSGKTVQSWEQEKTSLVLKFDDFYKHECSNLPSDLPEQALTVLKRLHAKAKDGIEAMFNTCKASQRKDADDFGTGLTKLASTVKKASDKEILRLEDEVHKSRLAVESFKRQIKSRLSDSREPESVEVVEDRRETRTATPISGGMGFDVAHRRATERGPRTPSSQTRAQRNLAQRQAPTLPPISSPVVSPVSRNVPARSPTRVPARSVVQGVSYRAPSPATVSPAMRTTSTARKSQASKSIQSEELGDIHPIMEETMRLGSAISQEYEDNLHMLDEEQSEWENMDEIDEVIWQSEFDGLYNEPDANSALAGSEDSPQDDSFEDLSARNSRLARKRSRLNKEIAGLHEKNEKFQEIIDELKGSNEMLTRENEDLRMYTGNQGQTAENANQIGIDEDLDFPTSLPRVPTIPHTPTTAGMPGSPLSTPRAHISTDTSKINSPLTPVPLARASTNDSIRSDWGKPIGTHFPGSLHRSDTSDMASPDDVGPYTGTMSDVMALLRSAVVRCNKDIQTCHKEKKTLPGHENSTYFLFESWEDSARRNRHDFRQTISYFQTISGKSSSKSRSHASSSSLGGSPRSVGSSSTATNTFKSFDGGFAEGAGWNSPAFVPPKSGNAPGLTNPEGKLHKSKTAQESPPMEGSVDKKGSTRGGSSSTRGGSSKKSQSNPKRQPQNSQKSSGSRTGTGGTKSSMAHGEKRGDDDDDDDDKIVRILTHPMLEKYRHIGMHPLFVAIILYLAVHWSSFKFWVDRQVRRPVREYITRKLPSKFSSRSTAIAMIMLLITGFFYLYFKTYLVYLVVQKERAMWRDGNNVAMRLELKRTGKPSGVSLWGLSEEQGLVRQSVGDFVEFICWSLGFTALKNSVSVWALNLWAAVFGSFSYVWAVVSDSASFTWEVCCWALAMTKLVLGNGINTAMHKAKLVFVGGH